MTTKLPIEIKELGEVCALTVGIDITKERNAKLEVMKVHNDLDEVQSKLIESEKQAALGAMMAGISHEINTPIGLGVTSITYLASVHDKVQTAFDDNSLKKSELETYLASSFEVIESIECNLVNAAELINSFKKMAINQLSDEVTVFNMRECIESVLTSLRHRLKRTKHKIDVVCDNSMMLRSNPGAFSQIFTNFIMNSIIHGFEDIEEGNITIEVTRLDNKLLVKYSDDGCGMSKEHIEKIFDPFFTTKKDSGGSGLGMGVVASLVKQSLDGEITCESEIGKGMTFVMAFPLE